MSVRVAVVTVSSTTVQNWQGESMESLMSAIRQNAFVSFAGDYNAATRDLILPSACILAITEA